MAPDRNPDSSIGGRDGSSRKPGWSSSLTIVVLLASLGQILFPCLCDPPLQYYLLFFLGFNYIAFRIVQAASARKYAIRYVVGMPLAFASHYLTMEMLNLILF